MKHVNWIYHPNWNKKLWSNLIIQSKGKVFNKVLKAFAYADKIEKYVKDNRASLEKKVSDQLIKKYYDQYSREYDMLVNLSDETILKEKKIMIAIKNRFEGRCKQEINSIPKCELNMPKEKILAHINQDLKWKGVYQQISEEIIAQRMNEILSMSKENYIAEKLKKHNQLITDQINKQQNAILSENTSVDKLLEYAKNCCYNNLHKNSHAAHLFFENDIKEYEVDPKGNTVLMNLLTPNPDLKYNHQIFNFLLDNKADINIRNKAGHSVAYYASFFFDLNFFTCIN